MFMIIGTEIMFHSHFPSLPFHPSSGRVQLAFEHLSAHNRILLWSGGRVGEYVFFVLDAGKPASNRYCY